MAKAWIGYVCPGCRTAFRVAADFQGCEVVCPACQEYLKLPEKPAVSPPEAEQTPEHGPSPVIIRPHAARESDGKQAPSPTLRKIASALAVLLAIFAIAWAFHALKPTAASAGAAAPIAIDTSVMRPAPAESTAPEPGTPAPEVVLETISNPEVPVAQPPLERPKATQANGSPADTRPLPSMPDPEAGLVAAVPYTPGAPPPANNTTRRAAATGDYRIHRVQRGDTLSRIGRQYGCDPAEIMRLNGLKNDMIRLGADLRIPPSAP
jgi:uncharacterized Zn finger protein (UPF0148 family)